MADFIGPKELRTGRAAAVEYFRRAGYSEDAAQRYADQLATCRWDAACLGRVPRGC